MKAGIVTITNGYNYGNRLQNYAVQESLKSIGIEAETIWKNTNVFDIENTKYLFKLYLKKILHYHLTKEENRVLNFHRFNRKYICKSKFIIDETIPEGLDGAYDYFIAGSDQVWNPYLAYCTEANFLTFTQTKKNVANSPSSACDAIPKEKIDEFTEWIKDFQFLSVREEKGAEIIEQLCKRKAEVLCDPTMFISAENWRRIAKRPKKIASKYLLMYFLGECNSVSREWIRVLAERNHLQVIELQNEKNFGIAPDEFIYLIDHAACVCTDSFHGSVFSLILHTPFVVFEREENFEKMNSRLDTLLSKMQCSERKKMNIDMSNALFMRFDKSDAAIYKEQKKYKNFLRKILEENK